MKRRMQMALCLLWSVGVCAAGRGAASGPGGLMPPVVVGTEEARPVKKEESKAALDRVPRAAPVGEIRVDEKAHVVRLPAAIGSTSGVVEWVLAADGKHRALSALVTGHSTRVIAEAFAKAGFPAGTPPAVDGEGRVRPPSGVAVEIDVVVRGKDGRESRRPASRYLSEKRGGVPVSSGGWVYVGPQVVRDAEAEILVSALTGSIVTTNLRDSSALIHWVPKARDSASSGRAYYVAEPLPPGETAVVAVEIRLAAPAGPVGGSGGSESSDKARSAEAPPK